MVMMMMTTTTKADDDTEDEGFNEALNFDDPTIAPPQLITEQCSDREPSRSSTQHGRQALCICLHKKTAIQQKIIAFFLHITMRFTHPPHPTRPLHYPCLLLMPVSRN